MQYTTHGLMTPADLADHQELYDLKPDRCDSCGGPLASDGVCADDSCGEVDALDFYDPQPRVTLTGEPMPTAYRLSMYRAQNRTYRITPAQRRRAIKKAGRDRDCQIIRWDGMGYPAARQGEKQLGFMPRPVSGAPV